MNSLPPLTCALLIDRSLRLLPPRMEGVAAMALMAAIGYQESRFAHRWQVVAGRPDAMGPARGFWQFEVGWVAAVATHPATRTQVRNLCELRGIAPQPRAIYGELHRDDELAGALARLLLWSDADPLPDVFADPEAGWAYYTRNWRPGKPHPQTWLRAVAYAREVIEAWQSRAEGAVA